MRLASRPRPRFSTRPDHTRLVLGVAVAGLFIATATTGSACFWINNDGKRVSTAYCDAACSKAASCVAGGGNSAFERCLDDCEGRSGTFIDDCKLDTETEAPERFRAAEYLVRSLDCAGLQAKTDDLSDALTEDVDAEASKEERIRVQISNLAMAPLIGDGCTPNADVAITGYCQTGCFRADNCYPVETGGENDLTLCQTECRASATSLVQYCKYSNETAYNRYTANEARLKTMTCDELVAALDAESDRKDPDCSFSSDTGDDDDDNN
jgi:hypothetical protein